MSHVVGWHRRRFLPLPESLSGIEVVRGCMRCYVPHAFARAHAHSSRADVHTAGHELISKLETEANLWCRRKSRRLSQNLSAVVVSWKTGQELLQS